MQDLESVKTRASEGIPASVEEALALNEKYTTDQLADAPTKRACTRRGVIDTCSIVNARSGRCSEDCKWCAQSRYYSTGINEYEIIPEEDAIKAAETNKLLGIKRLSLVTSGRKVAPADMKRFCDIYRKIARENRLVPVRVNGAAEPP